MEDVARKTGCTTSRHPESPSRDEEEVAHSRAKMNHPDDKHPKDDRQVPTRSAPSAPKERGWRGDPDDQQRTHIPTASITSSVPRSMPDPDADKLGEAASVGRADPPVTRCGHPQQAPPITAAFVCVNNGNGAMKVAGAPSGAANKQ